MRIIHFISGLKSGGSERNLKKIFNKNNQQYIFSFIKNNFYFEKKDYIFEPKNNNAISILKHILLIKKIIKKTNPQIIYCWMNHANIVAGTIAYVLNYKKIIWNIRSSTNASNFNGFNFIIILFTSFLSYIVPKKIIFNSLQSRESYKNFFINTNKSSIIYNGYKKNKIKKNIKKKIINFLCVARYHKVKNHFELIKAFQIFNKKHKNWKLSLVGRDIDIFKKEVLKTKRYQDILSKINFYSEKKKLSKFYYKSDFHILVSKSESFSNVIGESSSYGIPNICTDVGDNKKLIVNKKLLCKNIYAKDISKSLFECTKIYNNFKSYKYLSHRTKNLVDKKYNILQMINSFKNLNREIIK